MSLSQLLLDQQVAIGDHSERSSPLVDDRQRMDVPAFDQADDLTEGRLAAGHEYISGHHAAPDQVLPRAPITDRLSPT
jgi:hypothetical protein